MWIVPEARSAILRTSFVAAFVVLCIAGAVRTRHRWVRISLSVLAVPLILFTAFGVLVIDLILKYGPR